jgi:hypothetical protein
MAASTPCRQRFSSPKFSLFPEEVELRNQVAERYCALLAPYPSLKIPHIPEGHVPFGRSIQSSLKIRSIALASAGPCGARDPYGYLLSKTIHVQKAFAYLGYERGQFP